tara:strand:+ start:2441 stop:3139 length:699 start_codon:yes stop_codon:yes gene_type:complete
MTHQTEDDAARWARMVDAEERAFALLDAIEAAGIMKPGRTEGEVDRDIEAIAADQFGIARNWHQRLVRAGVNTTCIFSDRPPEVTIGPEDTVYVDMGPVFEQAEADVGRTYAMGQDPARHALVAALPEVFEEMRAFALAKPDVTGAEVYDFACRAAEARGYHFGGKIAGHTVGEFPHATWPLEPAHQRLWPDNPEPLSKPDHLGRPRYWILEAHLVEPGRQWGGFYERLLRG